MNKLLSSSLKSKLCNLSDGDSLYVGLDVHKKTCSAAFAINTSVIKTCVIPSDPALVVALLQPWRTHLELVVYEAGPTGFSLARALQRSAIPVKVVSASKLPRSPKRGSKSDRLDCCSLAELAASRLPLPSVIVPTQRQEADRQIVRQRERLKHKRRRVMQQIKSFLLQHGIPEPARCWSRAGISTLSTIELSSALRTCLNCLLDELEFYHSKLKRFNAELVKLAHDRRYRRQIELCTSHPGVGVTLSVYLVTELFSIMQVRSQGQLVSYCGLAPVVRQSGERSVGGPLMKSGKSSVRALLVQCAWAWVRNDSAGLLLYRRYLRNTGSAQKAIVATARRMLINLWAMLRRNLTYDSSAACTTACSRKSTCQEKVKSGK